MLKQKQRVDWGRLHASLGDVYASAGALRMKAALDNHSERKESICRRLGVICDADVSRVASGLRRKSERGSVMQADPGIKQ